MTKQTLQLRHQLSCSGVTLQTATYDATRHHVLSYDSCALAPHTLRLFSLRREVKSVRLFDEGNPAPPSLKPPVHKSQGADKNNKSNSNPKDPDVPIVHSLSLEYSKVTDVYICVYAAQSVPLSHTKTKRRLCDPDQAVYNVLFLEPATLKKLVNYPGPTSHRLRCVFYEDSSNRLVLAVQRKRGEGSGVISHTASTSDVPRIKSQSMNESFRTGQINDGGSHDVKTESERLNLAEGGPMYNHIDVLQISKRQFKVSKSRSSTNLLGAEEELIEQQQRTMLCIEKAGPALLHAETISLVCGSKRLTRLFGVGSVTVGSGSSASMESFLIEWRESSEQSLELIRRITLHDLITTVTLSPCSTWLFTGHNSGALRVWNVSTTSSSSGSRKRARNYRLESSPLEPETSAWHGHPISSLQVSARLAGESTELGQRGTIEAMVITADRDSGVVKHWRFQTGYQSGPSSRELELQTNNSPSNEQIAKIDLVGSYSCDSDKPGQQSKSALTKNKTTLLESALCTVPICVNIDMGSFTENLLLVLREDVIHVLKVQTVMHVLQATLHGDDISTIRIVEDQSASKLVVLSGNQFSSVRILTLDSSYQHAQESHYLHQLNPPASQRSASISAMECFQTDQERSFVVVGWSSGGVEIHSLDTYNRVAVLQDPRLNAHISAIGIVIHSIPREPSVPGTSVTSNNKPRVEPMQSWGGLLKSSAAKLHTANDGADDKAFGASQLRRSTVYIFAGTENGQIFGWKVPFPLEDITSNGTCRLLLESKIRVDSAHSAHVVQFTRLRQQRNRAERLVSLGADGMVKIWEVPSLSILGYVNTATERHIGMPSCMNAVEDPSEPKNQFVVVGFEDGMLAVWRLDARKVSFAELLVGSHHERRITQISPTMRSQPSCQSGSSHIIEFLTSSLDMTAIIWSIKEDSVEEKRYFDIGAPVIDIGTAQNVAVAALANEICAFEYCLGTPSSRTPMLRTSGSDQVGNTGLPSSTAGGRELYHNLLRPDTPTTHSDGETEGDNINSTEAAERMVNVLRVPTSLSAAEDAITIPSTLITSSKFTMKPAAATTAVRDADTPVNNGKKSRTKGTTSIQGDELCAKLQEYIESHGTNGTMSAENLTHFLSTERLAIIKRPDFAIRRHLQEQKMDLKTRLSVYDACEILLAIQSSSSEAQKGESDTKRQGLGRSAQQKKISMLKQTEKQKANRKAVITFNILGEKSIRWEAIDPASETVSGKRQVTSSQGSGQPSVPAPAYQRPESPSIRVPTDQAISSQKELSPEITGEVEVSDKASPGFEDGDRLREDKLPKRRKNRKLPVAESRKFKAPEEFPDHDLIHRLKLSHRFQEQWSKGYCWCSPCSELRVIWSDGGGAEEQKIKCEYCKRKIHTLTLKRQGYKPHFSLRMILGVIVEVYTELLAPSHSLLFKSAYKDPSESGAFSIHSTLYRVFRNKSGMQKVVEEKIKLFMVSATHYIREIDAIAVFGELLAMFAQDQSSSDAHVPNEMVALCVCCYSWFFSRSMVINGDLIIGSNHDLGYTSQDTSPEVENGKRTHWQFVSLQNALLCAQEMLMYPLVSPGYLRNILMYTSEYAHTFPTKPQTADEMDEIDCSTAQWIEIHRFLRLLVGEWKQQHSEFRVAEQTLFTQPLLGSTPSASSDTRAEVIEKLRLILSCFIFYDHEREGVIAIEDFTNILSKLRYLWPNENVTAEEAASAAAGEVSLTFENTILAAKRRFADVEGDGQICYLDFWAMLYIVGVRTLTLLKFREIPSFCRDYKLEISVDLHGLLLCYMERSSTMMLPRGFQLGKSSLDQRAAAQHLRRVGGLHDGVFRMPNALGKSLSLQELLNSGQRIDPKDQIYLEGSTPALGQSASVSAMDRFRPVTRDSNDARGQRTHGVAPVVVGVRHMGPRGKPRAFISVSAITNNVLLSEQGADGHRSDAVVPSLELGQDVTDGTQLRLTKRAPSDSANTTQANISVFSNTYIQFPFVSPQQRRLKMSPKENATAEHRLIGRITHSSAADETNHAATYNWHSEILKEHENEERASQIAALIPPVLQRADEDEAASASAKTAFSSLVLLHQSDHAKSRKSSRLLTAAIQTGTDQLEAPPKPAPSAPTVTEPVERKKRGTIAVIPKIEKDSVKPLIPASVVSAETIKHRLPRPQESKFKAEKSMKIDEKAAVVVKEQAQDSKPPMPDKWESATNDHEENSISAIKEPAKQEVAALSTPSQPSEPVVAPSVLVELKTQLSPPVTVIASEKDEKGPPSLPPEEITKMENDQQNEEANAAINPGGEFLDDDDAENSVDDQKEIDDDESQVGSRAATPRTTEEVEAVLNHGAEPIIDLVLHENATKMMFKNGSLNEDTVVTSVIKDELQISEPQKSTAKSRETELLLKTTALESHEKVEDLPKQTPLAVDEKVVAEKPKDTHQEQIRAVEATKPVDPLHCPVKDESSQPKESGLASHHSFRFSQQPAFRSNAPALNNPFRSGQWDPSNDSDSDEEKRVNESAGSAGGGASDGNGFEEEDDGENAEDIELQLTPEALQVYRASFGPRLRRSGVNEGLQTSLRPYGLAAAAASHLGRAPSTRNVVCDATNLSLVRRKTGSQVAVRWNDAEECALYGEKIPYLLGDDVVFSSEAEEQMQQKWLTFFNHAEAAMFSPLKQELQGREDAQRIQEELQSKLMKKRQEQQAQDTLRLQQSRGGSVVLKGSVTGSGSAGNSLSSSSGAADSANFRLRRMARESCQEIQNELRFGVSVQGEFTKVHEAQYFFFEYDPSVHGSILTLRLHVQRGEAEVFMSTETKVPCVSDFMWRSVEKSKGLNEGDGQKLVLYSNDLAKVVASASVASVRAGVQSERDDLVIPFYISVVAVEPSTKFALGIMASGQKMEPSRAIRMVDTLIEQFDKLSKSFEGRASSNVGEIPVSALAIGRESRHSIEPSESTRHLESLDERDATVGHQTGRFLDRVESRQKQSAFSVHEREADDSHESVHAENQEHLGEEGADDNSDDEDSDPDGGGAEVGDNCDSFQHLLESIGEKRGFGVVARSKSFFLTGPTRAQYEFILDEETQLEDVAAQYLPHKLLQQANPVQPSGSSAQDAIAVVTERHPSLSLASRRHNARKASVKNVKQRLSPIKGGGAPVVSTVNGALNPAATTLRVAKFAPKPIAYSLSSLDHSAHQLHSKSSVTLPPPRRTNLPQVQSTSLLK